MAAPISRRTEALLVALLSVGFAAWFTWPAWENLSASPRAFDWDGHMVFWTAITETVARFHQMPLWSPWSCGGMPLLANPESHVLTPFLLLDVAVGAVRGVRLEILLHLALMVAGGYVLGRTVGLSRSASLAPALVPAWSSAYPLHLGVGHTWALAYAYVPWVLALAYRAVARRRLVDAALAGAVLALMIHEGGTYPAPDTTVVVTVILGWLVVARRDLWPAAVLVTIAVFTFVLAAPHLLTTYELMKERPRLTISSESTSWRLIGRGLFAFDQSLRQAMPTDRYYWDFHEYGAYLGPVGAALAVFGALRGRDRARPFAIAALVVVALALGDSGIYWARSLTPPFSLWRMLHALPAFSSLRVPSRFLVLLGPLAGVLGGFGLDRLIAVYGSRARVAGLLALAAGAADASLHGPPNLDAMNETDDGVPPVAPHWNPRFEQLYSPAQVGTSLVAESNRGVLNCIEALAPEARAIGSNQPGYRGEQFMGGPGTVSLVDWTPNALTFGVDSPEPTVLVVNQNYDPGWTLTQGRGELFSSEGRLGVRVSAGAERLVLEYESRPFERGIALAMGGWAAIALLVVRARRRGRS